LIENAEDQDTS